MNSKSENVIYGAMHSACENNYIVQIYKLDARVRFYLTLSCTWPCITYVLWIILHFFNFQLSYYFSQQFTITKDVLPYLTDVPQVCLKRSENQDGSQVFTAVIKSIPAAYLAQWKVKGKDHDVLTPVDVNAEEYKGTSNSLPCPVLVVKKKEQLQNKRFHIEVDNFVGSRTTDISGRKNLFASIFEITYIYKFLIEFYLSLPILVFSLW